MCVAPARRRRRSSIGAATLDIWLVQKLERPPTVPGWSNVDSGTLVGAMRCRGEFKEIRGKAVKPGVYTLRYGLQPQNGDHLGISAVPRFPAAQSQRRSTRTRRCSASTASVALSKEVIGTAHPASLSLDPPEDAPGAVLSTYKNEHGHEGVVLQIGR